MQSLLRIATPPVAFKLSSSSHRLTPYSPFCKRAGFAAVLVDTNSPDGDPPPVAICHLKGFNPFLIDSQRLSFLTVLLQVRGCNTGSTGIAKLDASVSTTDPCSVFPVYGPFDLLYRLQDGGFGVAWAAKDLSTGRVLCLKAFRSMQDPNIKRSARTEFNVFRRLVKAQGKERGQQFVMELNRSFQHDSEVFFAMELMTTDLATYLFIEPEKCKMNKRRWMAQMALGIQFLHDMRILHRDIKSENMLIDSRENIRIIDFGLAFLYGGSNSRTQPIEYLGTPPYLAPEVLRNKGRSANNRIAYGTGVDWWALGCILYELESQDHQLLFDTEQYLHTYLAWCQLCKLGQKMTYPMFESFDPVVIDLLEGLLQVQPSTRYSLNDMEKHGYFIHHDGTNEFDDAGPRALERPVCPELVPDSTRDDGLDRARVEAARLSVSFDWTNLKWALDG